MDIQVGKRVTVDDTTLECIGYMIEPKNAFNQFVRFATKEKAMNAMNYLKRYKGHEHKEPYPIFRIIDPLAD